MRFSVVVRIYNIENYIGKCIESITNQTYSDYEILLIDDCSTDNSLIICKKYADKNHSVRIIHKERNGGIVLARKTGVELAKGEYIVFVDGDDFLDHHYLEEMDKTITEYGTIDLICCNYIRFSTSKQEKVQGDIQFGYYDRGRIEKEILDRLILSEDGCSFPPSIWAKAFRRDLSKFAQGNCDDYIKYGEDSAMVYPFVYRCNSMVFIKNYLYYYRVNPFSMTRVKKPLSWQGVLKYKDHLMRNIPMDKYDFYNQLCRYITYLAFIVAGTQFNSIQEASIIKQDIYNHVTSCELKCMIDNAQFHTWKGVIVKFALKHKMYFIMKAYNKTR